MLKTFRLAILFLCASISCNIHNEKDTTPNNYSETNFDFIKGVVLKNDSLVFRAKIEIKLDSNKISYWTLNGEDILKSKLLSKLEKIKISYPQERRNYFRIDLGIDKHTELHQFKELRDSLMLGNYRRASYLNSDNQRLSVRFPYKHNARYAPNPLPPPPPPGIKDQICLCCETDGHFRSSIINFYSKKFKNHVDCMKASSLNETYTYVHLEKDKFYWEGKELKLTTIGDSLQKKYTNYLKPNRFFMILKVDSLSQFGGYLDLYAVVRKSYIDRWNDESLKKFDALYKDLPYSDKKKIRREYPRVLVEVFDQHKSLTTDWSQ